MKNRKTDSTEIRTLIVNDSSVTSSVIQAILNTTPHIKTVGVAVNGDESVQLFAQFKPDIVIMDIHMPIMDGVEATRRIIQLYPAAKILIASATLQRNMKQIFSALQYGAIDYVHSPHLAFNPGASVSKQQLQASGRELLDKIELLQHLNDNRVKSLQSAADAEQPRRKQQKNGDGIPKHAPGILAIGCSTGGPTTVAKFLSKLHAPFPQPILICQHIDPEPTRGFVSWLAEQTGLPVSIARSGELPKSGHIYVAPGGNQNLEVTSSGALRLAPPKSGQIYLPNIDHLFSSLAKNIGKNACAVVLTGMGKDGAEGIRQIHQAGGHCYIQDPESAMVKSMPNAALKALETTRGYSPEIIARIINSLFL